jgi:anti-sigma B factor antagonist
VQFAHSRAGLGYKARVQTGTLTIEEEAEGEGGRRTLVLTGELDLVTAPSLERAVASVLEGPARELVLDVRGVQFVDSTGFRALLAAKDGCQAAGIGFAMTRGPDAVQRVFDVSGVLKRFRFV